MSSTLLVRISCKEPSMRSAFACAWLICASGMPIKACTTAVGLAAVNDFCARSKRNQCSNDDS